MIERAGRTRAVAALSVAAALIAVAACAPIAGTATTRRADVAEYKAEIAASRASVESSISVSRASVASSISASRESAESSYSSSSSAAAAAAARSACSSWRTNRDTRLVASRAMTDRTAAGDWTWSDINYLVSAAIAAGSTESTKLSAIITTAAPRPTLQAALTTYKSKLDAYTVALRNDQSAQRNDWSESNPAVSTLNTAADAVTALC